MTRTMTTAWSERTSPAIHHHGSFLHHLLEMTVAMMLGIVLGGVFTVGAAFVAGGSLSWDLESAELYVLCNRMAGT